MGGRWLGPPGPPGGAIIFYYHTNIIGIPIPLNIMVETRVSSAVAQRQTTGSLSAASPSLAIPFVSRLLPIRPAAMAVWLVGRYMLEWYATDQRHLTPACLDARASIGDDAVRVLFIFAHRHGPCWRCCWNSRDASEDVSSITQRVTINVVGHCLCSNPALFWLLGGHGSA